MEYWISDVEDKLKTFSQNASERLRSENNDIISNGSFWDRVDDNQNESHNQRHFKKAFLTPKRYEYSDWNSSLRSSQNYKEKSIAR